MSFVRPGVIERHKTQNFITTFGLCVNSGKSICVILCLVFEVFVEIFSCALQILYHDVTWEHVDLSAGGCSLSYTRRSEFMWGSNLHLRIMSNLGMLYKCLYT